jgi:peptide/nickel transport system permease protein
MIPYLLRRLVFLVLIAFSVTLTTFVLSHVIPGDPARLAAGPGAERQQVEAIRHRMGLDRPIAEQYVLYLQSLAHFDLGTSIVTRQPVSDELLRRLPATLELVMVSFAIYLVLGIPMAVIAATTRRPAVDVGVRAVATSAHAIPAFVLALWLQFLLFFRLGWFPSGGRLSITLEPPPARTGLLLVDSLLAGRPDAFADAAHHVVLPAIALTFGLMVIAVRLTRATLLTELGKDYVKMARLKGLSEGAIIRRHVLRNSLIPVLTLVGVQFGYLIGGTLVVEEIFSWPGLGAYAFDSIVSLDYAPVMGVVLVTTTIFVLVNFAIDLLYPLIDPRIRLWGETR